MFPGSVMEWNPLQLEIANWCAFYHNVYTMEDRPPNDVIENDAKLDAFLRRRIHEYNETRRKIRLESQKHSR